MYYIKKIVYINCMLIKRNFRRKYAEFIDIYAPYKYPLAVILVHLLMAVFYIGLLTLYVQNLIND